MIARSTCGAREGMRPEVSRSRRLRGAARHLLCPVLILACVVVAPGCAALGSASSDAAEVEATVNAYNNALSEAFVSLDMNALSSTATEKQAQEEYYLMAALGEGGVLMESSMTSIEFGDTVFSGADRASITTTETWDYDHVSLDTSETVRSERGVVYRLQYDLVLEDGHWLVDGVTSRDEIEGDMVTTP